MSKKLQRVFRYRPLTPDEVAADKEVRDKIMKEFPPKHSPAAIQQSSLSELLRKSIRESGKSMDELAGEAGVSPVLLAHFLAGQRDIHMTTADKLASSLGLELTVD